MQNSFNSEKNKMKMSVLDSEAKEKDAFSIGSSDDADATKPKMKAKMRPIEKILTEDPNQMDFNVPKDN